VKLNTLSARNYTIFITYRQKKWRGAPASFYINRGFTAGKFNKSSTNNHFSMLIMGILWVGTAHTISRPVKARRHPMHLLGIVAAKTAKCGYTTAVNLNMPPEYKRPVRSESEPAFSYYCRKRQRLTPGCTAGQPGPDPFAPFLQKGPTESINLVPLLYCDDWPWLGQWRHQASNTRNR
jgi:hypothetical protein